MSSTDWVGWEGFCQKSPICSNSSPNVYLTPTPSPVLQSSLHQILHPPKSTFFSHGELRHFVWTTSNHPIPACSPPPPPPPIESGFFMENLDIMCVLQFYIKLLLPLPTPPESEVQNCSGYVPNNIKKIKF